MKLFEKIFGTESERAIKKIQPIADKVLALEESVSKLTDKELKNKASELKLSNIDLGLKPATGKIDNEKQIPSTITDEETSEGCFACIYVPAGTNFKVTIKNIVIETESNINKASEDRKNVFVALKDITNSVKTLEEDEIELAKFENVNETTKITVLIWLGSLAKDNLVGSTISFTLSFDKIV